MRNHLNWAEWGRLIWSELWLRLFLKSEAESGEDVFSKDEAPCCTCSVRLFRAVRCRVSLQSATNQTLNPPTPTHTPSPTPVYTLSLIPNFIYNHETLSVCFCPAVWVTKRRVTENVSQNQNPKNSNVSTHQLVYHSWRPKHGGDVLTTSWRRPTHRGRDHSAGK